MKKTIIILCLLFLRLNIFAQDFKTTISPVQQSLSRFYDQTEFLGADENDYYVIKDYNIQRYIHTITIFDKRKNTLKSTIELEGFKSVSKAKYQLLLSKIILLKNTILVIEQAWTKDGAKYFAVAFDKTGKSISKVIELNTNKAQLHSFKAVNNELSVVMTQDVSPGISKIILAKYDENLLSIGTKNIDTKTGGRVGLEEDGNLYRIESSDKKDECIVTKINVETQEILSKTITIFHQKNIGDYEMDIKNGFIYLSTLYRDGINEKNELKEYDGFGVVKLDNRNLDVVYENLVPFNDAVKTIMLGKKYSEKDKINYLTSHSQYIKEDGSIVLSTEALMDLSEYDSKGNIILIELDKDGKTLWENCIVKSHMVKSASENDYNISLVGPKLTIILPERFDNASKVLDENYEPKVMNQHTTMQKTDLTIVIYSIDNSGSMTRKMAIPKGNKGFELDTNTGFGYENNVNYYLVNGKEFQVFSIQITK
jgi:hypothetical protein